MNAKLPCRTRAFAFALALGIAAGATAATAAPCSPSATALCLSGGRFQVEVNWKDFQERTGAGQAVSLTADTGYFWFFNSSNVELIVKVLDARAINQKFWVFFGALSNVEYTLTVTDSATGAVKTYLNSSGQFASVGDTGAFDGSAVIASHETVRVAGTTAPPSSIAGIQRFIDRAAPSASDFTPCPDTYLGFDLGGCRFHIEVSWKDSQGHTGVGIPVQLSNDTGYFWFFSESNVELMVKVLDARPINGSFWVFFGALSNVQYTIRVTDTLTGASRSYSNPEGNFASVGDTAAFRGGSAVASVPDPAHAASADLDPTGGAVSTTGADGTVFTLEIPPDALMTAETVTLTPVSRIDHFPYSGGLVAGVEIDPPGLDLLLPATLTIHPPSPPSPDRTLPYSYAAGGEDFILYPRDVDTSSVRIPLVRFAGFGIGLGGETDAAAQAGRMPTGTLSPYLQQYAHDVFLRVSGQISQAELQVRAKQISIDAFQEIPAQKPSSPAGGVLRPGVLPPGPEECVYVDNQGNPRSVREALQAVVGMMPQQQLLGTVEDSDVADFMASVIAELTRCIQEAFDHCVARNDPLEATLMLQLSLQLQTLGVDDPLLTTFADGGLLERCLRFEIDFESKVTEEARRDPVQSTERLKYRAQTVPLRLDYAGVRNFYGFRSVWEGTCSLLPEDAAFYYTSGGSGCTVEVRPGKGQFQALAAWIGLPTFYHGVRVLYMPGDPEAPATLTCPQHDPDPNFGVESFMAPYSFLHQNEERDGVFKAQHWTQLRFRHGFSQNDHYLAKRSYEQSKQVDPYLKVSEETFFFLKHTPDAPMPDCP